MKNSFKTNSSKFTKVLSTLVPQYFRTSWKSAFTLAETLIVIGIIGVVAALTLPNLNHATGDKEKITKVKKIYAALTDAVDRAQVIYGDFDTWFKDIDCDSDPTTCNERFAKRVTEFMKISKDCGFDEGCFSSAPLLLSNGDVYDDDYLTELQSADTYMLTTSDGMSLGFMNYELFRIRVDIDGLNKGKNQYGNDIFDFSIYVDNNTANDRGTVINQLYSSYIPDALTGELSLGGWGDNVTAWVIQNENLDYLKLDSEGNCPDGEPLNWETKTSCE